MKNKIETRDVNFWYGDFHALKGISMDIEEKSVIAFIGPSGCGKSTFLRLLNRMNDLIPDTRLTGEIRIDGQDIYGKGVQVDELRKNVGMVFPRPNPSARPWAWCSSAQILSQKASSRALPTDSV